MSNGVHAKRGFNYQDTVILDLLLTFFEEHRASGTVRPEGIDDLELAWCDSAESMQKRFVQVKKPREDNATNPTNSPWTLPEVTRELIPGTLSRLKGNTWQQDWILGDELYGEVSCLMDARGHAPIQVPKLYWLTIHRLARNKVLASQSLDSSNRKILINWSPSSELLTDSNAALRLTEEFGRKLEICASRETAENYGRELGCIHDVLPDVLSRIRCHRSFGSVEEVAERVQRTLHEQYNLDAESVSDTLFRNLRCFVSDISTIPGRWFNAEEFEIELRTIWPTMVPIRTPPPLEQGHIRRPELSASFTSRWNGRALEAVGISGAGKTMLAAEVYEESRKENPRRPVFYVEVRLGTQLRDALIGVAFHLRRYGYTQPFCVASTHVRGTTAHEVAIQELVQSLASVPEKILLLIDMIDGSCSDDFSRDVRVFANSITETGCRVAFLGQESAFRHLTDLERQHLGLRTVDIRGFKFEEFLELVRQKHEELDHQALHCIFNAFTAGRSAGLYARLARTLADTPTIAKMRELSSSPPEHVLQRAERGKFANLSPNAQLAARKLVCFALPFSRRDAVSIFHEESIGLAMQELLEIGLLRKADEDTFEMHETVRAGLEGVISSEVRKEAHTALATHYAETEMVPAEIFHLGKAGLQDKAQERARISFLLGKHWPHLYGYVITHQLVTVDEVIDVVSSHDKIDGIYLLSNIMSKLGEPADAEKLLQLMRMQLSRFGMDYNWSLNIASAFLTLKPDSANELYRLAMVINGVEHGRENAISAILIASRRHAVDKAQSLVALFDSLSEEEQLLFVPVLLENGKRDCLTRAFRLIPSHTRHESGQPAPKWGFQFLHLQSLNDVVEFLASIPEVNDAEMLALQSPLLGRLASFVWANRDSFGIHGVEVLQSDDFDPKVQKAALRVLALIGNSQFCDLCDELSTRTSNPIHGFAALAPCLAPGQIDMARYETRFLNEVNSFPIRVVSLSVLAAAGADLNLLYEKLCDVEKTPSAIVRWDFLILKVASEYPFRAALPVLQAQLSSLKESDVFLHLGAIRSLGTLAVPEATEMLGGAVANQNRMVRGAAALGLQEKRHQETRASLTKQLRSESQKEIRPLLAAAICASGPSSVDDVTVRSEEDQNIMLWQCIVAARTRDQKFAGNLVTIALNTFLNWQLRRAAISAAGFLPFEVSLKHMLPILRLRSTLLVDDHIDFYAHSFVLQLFDHEADRILQLFATGRGDLVSFVSQVCDEHAKAMLHAQELASGVAIGEWLYCRLSAAGPPYDSAAVDAVTNELSSPLLFSAMLRSLRRLGRADLIEKEIARSERRWFAAKCIIECKRCGYNGVDDADRLRELLANSPVAGDGRLIGIIEEVATGRRTSDPSRAAPSETNNLVPAVLKFEEAELLLTPGANGDYPNEQSPVLLRDLTMEQFAQLVEMADPGKDREQIVERYVPGIVFQGDGHSVATRQVTYSSGNLTPGAFIRPAIVAANLNGQEIGWHDEMLASPDAKGYVQRVLRCIAVSGNSEVLFDLLNRYSEDFLQALGSHGICEHVAPLIDSRIVPFLSSNVSAGTDEMLEILARLAGLVETPEIDRVLTLLLKRWTDRLKNWQFKELPEPSHHFWRAFRRLSSHPRFGEIDDWHRNLAPVLYSPLLPWYHRRDVAGVLEGDPRSHIQLETIRFKAQDWQHFYEEEIDWLEEACERLFGKYQKSILRTVLKPPCQ